MSTPSNTTSLGTALLPGLFIKYATKAKATPTRTTLFSKEKGAALGGTRTHDTPLSRQSALPAELPGQLSRQGSQSTTQHNTTLSLQHSTTQDKVKPQYSVLWHRKPSLNM